MKLSCRILSLLLICLTSNPLLAAKPLKVLKVLLLTYLESLTSRATSVSPKAP